MSSSGPLTTSKKRYTSVPISRNESSGSELVKYQQRVSTAGKFDQKDIGAVAKKDEKPNRRTGKDKDLVQKKKKKGEINLDKLRNKKMLNDIVEKQLSEICRKGKLFDIDITDCITQNSSDDSSDFSCLSHDHEQKRDLKKEKVKKDTFFGKSNKSSKKHAVSESTESMDSNSDSDSSNTSESDRDSKKKVFKSKRKVKSGMVARASDDVQNPQTWPQTALQYEYINKSVAFQDLDFKLFVAGELEIIISRKTKIDERNTRLSLLKKIVYYSNIYQWKALLYFYAAFLRQIEGVLKLGKIIQVI